MPLDIRGKVSTYLGMYPTTARNGMRRMRTRKMGKQASMYK